MAEKGYPAGYPQNPPPYNSVQSQSVYAPPGSSVHVHSTQSTQSTPYPGGPTTRTNVVVTRNTGLFGRLENSINYLGDKLDNVATDINHSVQVGTTSILLNMFTTGNIIQLISRSHGHALQIVQSPTGQLVIDGMGAVSPQAMNAHWTVVNEGNNLVRLHNNHNYLAIVNGATVLMNSPPGSQLGIESRLRLYQIGNFMTLGSVKEPNRHIGILPDGTLKPAVACGLEDHSQFGVQVVYSPYSQSYPKAK